MLEVSNIALPLDAGLPEGGPSVRAALARVLGLDVLDIQGFNLLKRSVDARKKHDVHFVCTYAVQVDHAVQERVLERGVKPPVNVKLHVPYAGYRAPEPERALPERPVVVGFGPAGLFCAWVLAQAGTNPIVLERGRDVDARTADVEAFSKGGPLDANSNVQFGEGGAGTFSDGKLTSGIKNPRCADVLHAFVDFGAPAEILWQAKPHIGTDRLAGTVRAMRERIIELGGEVRFNTRLDGLDLVDDRVRAVRCTDVRSGDSEVIPASDVVLACGHSARDTFAMLKDAGFAMERKSFAAGVRIEHLQRDINRAQYGSAATHPALGAADYKLAVHLPAGRGVYTFCMCPGGEVVCAASEDGGVCVNGMSRFARDGRNANAAVLVGIDPEDLPGDDVLAGVELQRQMEQAAYAAAGGTYAAPAQTVGDYLANRSSSGPARGKHAVQPTYARGVVWCDLRRVLPGFIGDALADALPLLDRRLKGFANPAAVLTGVEARSSSPVRIVRDRTTCMADAPDGTAGCGLYPCGEGAGYAGGIMSAAVDGIRVAECLIGRYQR
ncbi:FAD dependent oxidoreductase [Slackia heliotrinireducens]|uniref:FAD-dependent dehydrogenase n=1 Tax=Slackia heliotrinireducens (strain ATCC 29202 / DSM 20476 / NCTC 11029 / RHS 1) TaxID=471855 RepID=C7N6J5_SLAHD|nr:FAD-dependent oxidoreductase [Slackia heliotrinireducens]ACV22530.1 FAD-dependent dehydrogenase [Slackia heliotrinireducens DSM 20476]VEH00975.1 FAD dependent oxidoreductase [Slackia heliotrinireducens]